MKRHAPKHSNPKLIIAPFGGTRSEVGGTRSNGSFLNRSRPIFMNVQKGSSREWKKERSVVQ